jgi:hypothetical protein
MNHQNDRVYRIACSKQVATNTNNWAAALYRTLHLLLHAGGWRRVLNNAEPIDIKPVRKALLDTYTAYVATFKPIHEGEGSRLGVYFREWGDHALGKVPLYLRKSLPTIGVDGGGVPQTVPGCPPVCSCCPILPAANG